MKKKISVFWMMLVLMVIVCSGCGEKKQDGDRSQNVSTEQEDSALLKDMEEINTLDSIVDRNGRAFYTLKDTMADGTNDVYTIYQDEKRYVEESVDGTLIVENGDVYGMDAEQNIPFRYLFIEDTYEDFVAEYKTELLYEYNTEEKITSKKVSDGRIYLETKVPKETVETYYTAYGFTSEEVDYMFFEYEIDAETKEILEMKSYVVSGEEKILYSDIILDRECEEYTPDQEITEGVFGSDSRTLSVVSDAGTADEKTYTQTVTKGSGMSLYIPEEFEEEVYADPEYTKAVEVDRTMDQTVYLKRIEEASGN